MDAGQNISVVDQLFDAIDAKNYAAARYKLSRAIDAAKRNTMPKTTANAGRPNAPDCEGQA